MLVIYEKGNQRNVNIKKADKYKGETFIMVLRKQIVKRLDEL